MLRKVIPVHSFDVSIDDAKKIQKEYRGRVVLEDSVNLDEIRIVGGVDVAFLSGVYRSADSSPGSREAFSGKADNKGVTLGEIRPRLPELTALAAVVLIDSQNHEVLEISFATAPVYFPYIPGFLSFREGPAVLAAIKELDTLPGVMIYDGCGIAHPRGFGLASHMGVLTGIPSSGCAKSLLCGSCDEPQPLKGSWTELTYKEKIVGSCLRTRDRVKPVYVSPGSGLSIDGARELVIRCTGKYRLPEPTRLAHKVVSEKKKELKGKM